ncbi:ankyrin repeat and SOCS box protein 10 isoform X1 [Microcaecilia unicolor]|uniref:Ankyrin repeat and SOCS box protein 10-like isoform X1 n=1 Tax=Microcaecilia unicolor TaxID=1415580 RepID=A0A6P7XB02_9AMPH|nr:ankyrin repeat and SOCS box protein 10-like isoform X1 [Microcaecilia unicolor]
MYGNTFAFSSSALRSIRLEAERSQDFRHDNSTVLRYLPERRTLGRENGIRSYSETPVVCRDMLIHNALFTGDLERVQQHFTKHAATNLVIESRGEEMRWICRKQGLWSLTYEQELTTPLHITASRGYTDCLRHLLLRGADVDFSPGGQTPLHEACENSCTESVQLLLSHGANPNAVSEDGYCPLHCCKTTNSIQCAKLLLQYGAHVNVETEEEDDTPLHIAARQGLEEHVNLFLDYGASLEKQNDEGHTPLNAACNQSHHPEDIDHYYSVCKQLIENGANIHTLDRDQQRPLHLACKNANPKVVELLLAHGANVNIMNYSGNTAMQNVLQVVAYKPDHQPEVIVRALLNHGSVRIWPGALTKVLKYCSSSPRTIEALINSYDRVRVSDSWVDAVSPEIVQKHLDFYQSLFCLSQKPRSLQHLTRCAIRNYLEGRLHLVLPKLPLPPALLQFLMLSFEDILY